MSQTWLGRGISAGVHFGLTSGVITTLGLIVGLHSGTHSLRAVIGGIVTIAVADALSDALGIHISKESERTLSSGEVWAATGATFVAKFVMALTFLIPLLWLSLSVAIIVSVAWGFLVLALLSFAMAKSQRKPPGPIIGEHLGIALLVVVFSQLLGGWIGRVFSS